MPGTTNHILPGVKGKDYHFVKNGGQVYVIYDVQQPGIPHFKMSFKIDPRDYDAYGISPGQVNVVNNATFKNFQHVGNASEIILNGTDHPFDQYLQHLKEINGGVSWLNDKTFVGTMLEGYLKGWTSTETQQALQGTQWFQNRTQTQRDWALNLSRADRNAAVKGVVAQMQDQLKQLYGPGWTLKDANLNQKQLEQLAQNIASGKFGTVDEGFQLWSQHAQNHAEQIQGTPAWIAAEQQQEQINQFNNRPEDMFQQIKQQSEQWLGPNGTPDVGTLQSWANKLVVGTSSSADWEQYLQKQASSLYPWLNPGETWQDRASSYKNIAEQQLDGPVNWNDKLLSNLGQMDANGKATGGAMSYDDFTKAVRSDGRFWQGSTAANETYSLFNRLNATFNGQGVG